MDKRAYAGLEVELELELQEQILAQLRVWQQDLEEWYEKDDPQKWELEDSAATLSMKKTAFVVEGWVWVASAKDYAA